MPRSSLEAARRPAPDPWDVLPPVLRRMGPLSMLLAPPAHLGGDERLLFPIRMTLAMIGSILFFGHAVVLLAIGQEGYAALAALAFAIVTLFTAIFRFTRHQRAPFALGWVVVYGYVVLLHLTFGIRTGALLYALPIAMVAYLVFRPDQWALRLVPVGFAFACVAVLFGFADLVPRVRLEAWVEHLVLSANAAGTLYAVLVLSSHHAAVANTARRAAAEERDRADRLLLSILPAPIAERLKRSADTIADAAPAVTVLFADIVGFTTLASRVSSTELVRTLNEIFTAFDRLAERHGIEKIKTIGDAYMAVSGLPEARADHAARAVRLAIDMMSVVARASEKGGADLSVRVGVHSGPAIAGVIGVNKFAYDLWGDTVNVASRMESHGLPGRIHMSEATRALLPDEIEVEERGIIEVKGKGAMRTFFVARPPAHVC